MKKKNHLLRREGKPNKADVVDLQPAKGKMILGLDFIIHDNRSVTITKDYLLISTNSQMSPIIDELTSELQTKHGDAPTNVSDQCPCDIPGSCKINIHEFIKVGN